MSTVQRDRSLSRVNRLGGILVELALVAVVIAYPLPAIGLDPLLGAGGMFLPLIASMASLLMAIVGGVFLVRAFTQAQPKRTQRLGVRILVPVSVVAVINAYLVIVARFAPQSLFIIGAVLLAIVGGVADAGGNPELDSSRKHQNQSDKQGFVHICIYNYNL